MTLGLANRWRDEKMHGLYFGQHFEVTISIVPTTSRFTRKPLSEQHVHVLFTFFLIEKLRKELP